MVYHGKVSFSDAYNMPVFWRRWWIQKVQETLNDQNKAQEEANRKSQHRTPKSPSKSTKRPSRTPKRSPRR